MNTLYGWLMEREGVIGETIEPPALRLVGAKTVFQLHDAHGMPWEMVFACLRERGYIPEPIGLALLCARHYGWDDSKFQVVVGRDLFAAFRDVPSFVKTWSMMTKGGVVYYMLQPQPAKEEK